MRADLPGVCPDCGGDIDAEGEASRWIEDIAITTGWLWTFAIEAATVYLVDHERSFDAASRVLDPDYEGVIEQDGGAPYRRYKEATAQSCLAHLLRRCSGLIDAKVPRAP